MKRQWAILDFRIEVKSKAKERDWTIVRAEATLVNNHLSALCRVFLSDPGIQKWLLVSSMC
jgi:hypothetical protein